MNGKEKAVRQVNKNEEMYSSWQDNHETESETVKNDQKITIVQLNKLSGFKNNFKRLKISK